MSKARITLLDAMADANLFASWFRDPTSWAAWRAFLKSLFALPMNHAEFATYKECTRRTVPTSAPATEAWLVCGRRSGKSFVLALVAVFLACFHDFSRYLTRGERATVMILAADRRQSRVILRYIHGLLTGVPMLKRMIERETAESFDLSNTITIEVATASFKTVRGYTICAGLLDELAFWPTDDTSSNPDDEIISAIRPGMATIPNAMLLCASSPYSRRGALWDAHRKHFAQNNDPILVWQAPTLTMNPTVPQSVIDEAMERDPVSAAAEFGAEFRRDIEAFVLREAVAACVSSGVFERAPQRNISYIGFADPSGGSADSMTLAIGHKDYNRKMIVVDALREARPPFSPEIVAGEFARLLKSYRVFKITGDRYAGEWPREQFSKFGIRYEATAKSKSEMYVDLLPLINSRQIDLLDHTKLVSQLCSLERRTARGGRDSIDHPPQGHDDLINAVAGLAAGVTKYSTYNLDAMAS
jgi:hypothetical protein